MRTTRYSLLFLILIAFWSCEDFTDHDMEVETGSVSFESYMAVGNSLTAGFQSNALYEEAQKYAFPNLIANQAGLKGQFETPFISPGLGSRIEVVQFTTNPASPIVTTQTMLTPGGAPSQPTGGYNNVGIPGAVLADYLNADGNLAQRAAANPAYVYVLGSQATNNGSIHAYVADKDPTLVTFWLGNNDILGYATSGGLRPFTPPAGHPNGLDFQTMFTNAIGSILGINGDVKVVAANIPNVTSIAFTRTVGPGFVAGLEASGQKDKLPGVVVQRNFYQANAQIGASENRAPAELISFADIEDPTQNAILLTGQSIVGHIGVSANTAAPTYNEAAVTAILNYWRSFLVNAGQATEAQAAQMSADQIEGALEQIMIGQYAQTFGVTPQAAAQQLGAAADFEFDQPFMLSAKNPLPSQFVLDHNEISIASTVVGIYNNIINQVLSASSDRTGLVDVNSLFDEIVANGGVSVDGELLTPTILSIFSLDGVHPTNKGHGYVANQFIHVLNTKYGADLREVNLESLPSGIPLSSN